MEIRETNRFMINSVFSRNATKIEPLLISITLLYHVLYIVNLLVFLINHSCHILLRCDKRKILIYHLENVSFLPKVPGCCVSTNVWGVWRAPPWLTVRMWTIFLKHQKKIWNDSDQVYINTYQRLFTENSKEQLIIFLGNESR